MSNSETIGALQALYQLSHEVVLAAPLDEVRCYYLAGGLWPDIASSLLQNCSD